MSSKAVVRVAAGAGLMGSAEGAMVGRQGPDVSRLWGRIPCSVRVNRKRGSHGGIPVSETWVATVVTSSGCCVQ